MSDTKTTPTSLVYIGRRFDRGELRHCYLDADGTTRSYRVALGAGKRGTDGLGCRYVVEMDDDGAAYPSTTQIERGADPSPAGQADCLRWRGLDIAAHVEASAHKARKKAEKADPLLDALAPLREAYRAAGWRGREALLAAVLRRITS